MAKEISIDFYDDGRVEVEAHGYTGKGCKLATADIEAYLGKSGAMRKKKEYFRGLKKRVQTRLRTRG